MGELVDFDLPPLDDSNSIILPNESPIAISRVKTTAATQLASEPKIQATISSQDSTVTSAQDSTSSPTSATSLSKEETKSFTVVLARLEQIARLPHAWNFDFIRTKNALLSSVHWLNVQNTVPIYSVHDYRLLVQSSPLIPSTNLMAQIDTIQDCSIPCQLLSNTQISDPETLQNWTNALTSAAPVPIHSLAAKFATLLDANHDETPKIDLVTRLSPNPIYRMTDCVFSSNRDSLSPHCYESAVTENPLLNALATAALSDSWFDVSPDLFNRVIDLVLHRYRNTLPFSKDPLNAGCFANFCVEDTTASTASFSASLPSNVDRADVGYSSWESPHYYYNYFASQIAGALVSNFTGKPVQADDTEDEKAKKQHVQSTEKILGTVNVALASQPCVHITSTYDSAKSLSALHHSFVHPDSNTTYSNDVILQTLKQSRVTSAILNEPTADFVTKSSTISKTFELIAQLDLKRNVPTSDLQELVQNADDTTSEYPIPLTKDVFHITKVVTTGHFTEWRTMLNRVKEQYFRSPQELKCWLGAMFWMIAQFCKIRDNYKDPDNHYSPNLLDEKDVKFLRLAVGEKLANLFATEDCKIVQGDAKGVQYAPNVLGFFKRFFWFNPQTDRVGGFAMLLFPFDTSLFLPIAKKSGNGFHNGSLLRTLHTLVPLGYPASEVSDIRTQCSYTVNSSYWQMTRKITYGVAGYATTNVKFAREKADTQCVHVVFAAFDNVVSVKSNEVIHRLPEHQRKTSSGVDTSIDRSLERFTFSPKLQSVDGTFNITTDKVVFDKKAGFDRPQVSNAVSARKCDETLFPTVFSNHIKNYRLKNNETVAQRKKRLSKDDVKQDNVKQDDVKQDDVKQDDVKQDNVIVDMKQDNINLSSEKDRVSVDIKKDNVTVEVWDIVAPSTTSDVITLVNTSSAVSLKKSDAQIKKDAKKNQATRLPLPPATTPKKKTEKPKQDNVKNSKPIDVNTEPVPVTNARNQYFADRNKKRDNANNQMQIDEELARNLQCREFSTVNTHADDLSGFTQVVARKNRKPRSPPLIATLPSEAPQSSTTPVLSVHISSQDENVAPSAVNLSCDAAEQVKDQSLVPSDSISINASSSSSLLSESPPNSVATLTNFSDATSSVAVVQPVDTMSIVAQSEDLVTTLSLPAVDSFSFPTNTKKMEENVLLAPTTSLPIVVDTTPSPLPKVVDTTPSSYPVVADTTLLLPLVGDTTNVSDLPIVAPSPENPVSVSTLVTDAPVPVISQPPTASFYTLPTIYHVDREAQMRSYHTIRSHIAHVRHWLMMAPRDRSFSHEKTVLIAHRNAFEQKDVERHLSKYTDSDDNLRLLTPWAILSTAFDHNIENTPEGAPMQTIIINGGPSFMNESQFQILSNVGRFILNSVLNAAYTPTPQTNSNCSTCFMCRIAAPFRYCFIPQYIDANHTVCTRLIPLCVDDNCSLKLMQKVADRSHQGGVAKFPGLRCFFNINGTVTVCESEADVFKMTIGTTDATTVEPSIRIVNSDFTSTANAVFTSDQHGNVFALPQKVAEKAFHLAQFMLRTEL